MAVILRALDKHFHQLPGGAILEIWPNDPADSILFFPGTMLAPGHYELLISMLWQKGLTVGALHFSGHGRAMKSSLTTFSRMMEQGWEAVAWLKAHGFGSVAICGHSQGGIIALALASRTGIKACFSICAVFPRMEEAIRLTRFAPLRKYRSHILDLIKWLAKVCPWLPVPLPAYLPLRKLLAGKRRPVYMGADKGRISYPLRFMASLFDADINPALACPYVLFSAQNDYLFDREIILKTFEMAHAPLKELIWLPDGGHMAPLNPTLARFISAHIAAFCAGQDMRLNIRKQV